MHHLAHVAGPDSNGPGTYPKHTRSRATRQEVRKVKFVIHRSKDDRFYWTVVGGNGEVMAQSQMMQAKASCMSSIESIMKNAAGATVVDKTDED